MKRNEDEERRVLNFEMGSISFAISSELAWVVVVVSLRKGGIVR